MKRLLMIGSIVMAPALFACEWQVVSTTPQQTCTNYDVTCTSSQVRMQSWTDILEVNSCTGASQTVQGNLQSWCAFAPASDENGHGTCG